MFGEQTAGGGFEFVFRKPLLAIDSPSKLTALQTELFALFAGGGGVFELGGAATFRG